MEERLHVLHILKRDELGGLSRYVRDLSRGLIERGVRVTIACRADDGIDSFQGLDVEVLDLPIDEGLGGVLKSGMWLRKWVKKNHVNVLHVHHRSAAMVALPLRKLCGVKSLYTLHLTHLPRFREVNAFVAMGDYYHVPSKMAFDWLVEQGVDERKIQLIVHGIDMDRYRLPSAEERKTARKRFGFDDDVVVGGYVGRFEDPKNEDWLLDVAMQMKNEKAGFLFAGGGAGKDAFERKLKDLGLGNRAVSLANVDPLEVYWAMDCFLLPSGIEGFSLATGEAMACGLPVCRTRTAGCEELVLDGETGVSVRIDREAFVNEAVGLMRMKREALLKMGGQASSYIRSRFTEDEQVADTMAYYEKIAGVADRKAGLDS
ncbi:D-inositol 3-phosphate glycosyltransferase [Poriferisphaera corsica]|uniref:D-inositol 3-phosphate glycosyltransferase n=1 Tax=Poriferisphaera corsica TaxID=2528020 RepID=A0A517YQ00_9BACT|nr:glycosyltransferase family 4 protein [Poriferisphaera corsica]QDU32295.1 D-inositol 3-phosphate glycosyltransferase [Poriferisphaera corsica]